MRTYSPPAHITVPNLVTASGAYDHADYMRREKLYLAELAEWVKSTGQAHPLAGKFVSVPYADSAAHYMVGKLGNSVSLIILPLGDAWRDARFERTATVAELKRLAVDVSSYC
jgi:hypothetical protein